MMSMTEAFWFKAAEERFSQDFPNLSWEAVSSAEQETLKDKIREIFEKASLAARIPGIEEYPITARIWKRREEWVLELSGSINDTAFTTRHTEHGSIPAEDVPGLPTHYQWHERLVDAGLASDDDDHA